MSQELLNDIQSRIHASTVIDREIYKLFGFEIGVMDYRDRDMFGEPVLRQKYWIAKHAFTLANGSGSLIDHITYWLNRTIDFFESCPEFKDWHYSIYSHSDSSDLVKNAMVQIETPDHKIIYEGTGMTAALAFCAAMVQYKSGQPIEGENNEQYSY
jgi:hypothetical protein